MSRRGTARLRTTISDLRGIFIGQKCPDTGGEEAIMWWAHNIVDEEKYYRGISKAEPLWKPERVLIVRPGQSSGAYNSYGLVVYCNANGVITDLSVG